jgi:hypothetical protein
MTESQKLIAKNTASVPHDIAIHGFNNVFPRMLPPSPEEVFHLQAEKNALSMSCGAHAWMKGWLWVFDHSYHGVTDVDGKFILKGLPAGRLARRWTSGLMPPPTSARSGSRQSKQVFGRAGDVSSQRLRAGGVSSGD